MVKIFQFGDLHDSRRFSAVADFLKGRKDIDAGVFVGDLGNGWEYNTAYQEAQEEKQEILQGLNSPVSEQEMMLVQIVQQLNQFGGVKNAEKLLTAGVLGEHTEEIEEMVGICKQNEELIPEAISKYNAFVKANKADLEKAHRLPLEAALKLAERDAKQANDAFKKMGIPIVGIPGNHDLFNIYQHLNCIHWLDKQGPKTVAGIKFGGVMNWCKPLDLTVKDANLYQHVEDDVLCSDVEKDGDKDKEKKFYEQSKTIQRFKDVSIDCLVSHQGFVDKMTVPHGSYAAAKHVLDTKKPKLNFCGHVHGKGMYDDTHGYQALKSTDRFAYVVHIDDASKKIKKIEVYEWVYEDDQAKLAT